MDFEWDRVKNRKNIEKHGVSFKEGTRIWQDIHIEAKDIAKSVDGETRNATIGFIGQEVYVAIWTKRDLNIRIISVRRARDNEKKTFLSKF